MPRRRRYLLLAIVAAIVAAIGMLVPSAFAKEHGSWINAITARTAQTEQAGVGGSASTDHAASVVNVDFKGEFLGWAMRDSTGVLVGEKTTSTSSTESMIKTWMVADYLRRAAEKGTTPSRSDLRRASEAIRWSDDDDTQVLYKANGGNASVMRMIEMCGLRDTKVYDNWWSRTQMSPRDAVTLGECIANGIAAGKTWTPWLLNEMRNVEGTTAATEQWATRGGGRWGIIDGVPASMAGTVAIKNGWTSIGIDGNWHLSCLAIGDGWTMSVMMRYPSKLGLDYGAGVCRSVASQLLQ